MAQVKLITGNKILRILKAKGTYIAIVWDFLASPPPPAGLAPSIPEDLYHMIKKGVSIRKHLEKNRKVRQRVLLQLPGYVSPQDRDSKFRLILVESRIHRLARWYKTKRVLPPNWK